MKRIIPAAVLTCFAVAASLLALPQKHPSVAPGVPETSAEQLHCMLGRNGKVLVLDVRTSQEYARGHIPGAVNVPIEILVRKIRQMKVSKGTTVVTMCDYGGRSSRAAMELRKMGYQATSFCRIESWRKDGYKIRKGNTKPQTE